MYFSSTEIRQLFFNYFQERGHLLVPSAPIVMKNDPTLLFTNAGMNQFKEYFLGHSVPPAKRIVDTQKCLRVSGKHNDLEEVGVDTYHHTMFEMLGNWSFNDYFKDDAIRFSWELLTDVYKLDPNRLYATVFEGDANEGLPVSSIALKAWQNFLPPEHIIFGNKKDNFWEMGDSGPCGPCSEIHIDLRPDNERQETPGHLLINKDHPQVIEIWNNVFIMFDRKKDGSLEKLTAVHVDTGMGFERLVRVIQGKKSNYETDIFMPTILKVQELCHLKYDFSDSKKDIAFRVISDHIRAISFTISDGQLPSNTGAGYIIRRILRRAVRYYYSFLNCHQPLLFKLVDLIAQQFEHVFPELLQQQNFIKNVIEEEEHGFLKTLSKGLHRLDEITANCSEQDKISGNLVFELLDTYGFPIDLTRLIVSEKNLLIDEDGFKKAMEEQRQRSKTAGILVTEDWVVLKTGLVQSFVGYTHKSELTTHLIQYRQVLQKGQIEYQWVIERSPFYGESGGQVGDQGWLKFSNETIDIIDTQKENNLIVLISLTKPNHITEIVQAFVNYDLRDEITAHHSATHLLHAALKQVLGKHVNQKGSLVNNLHLRFDFTHFAKISDEQIDQIQAIINAKIKENIPVVIKEMPKDNAIELGATALFGEKYGDIVRVVTIDPKFSVELCGGTHVSSTAQLGAFVIKHETAIAAGVRRLEAVTSKQAFDYYEKHISIFNHLQHLLKNPKDIIKSIDNLLNEQKQQKKYIEQLEHFQINVLTKDLALKVVVINHINFIAQPVSLQYLDLLKKLAHNLQHLFSVDYLFCIWTIIDQKIQVVISTPKGHLKLNANQIIKDIVCPLINGSGGGQPTLAAAGGSNLTVAKEIEFSLIKFLEGL